jgi:hypothetical protein
MQGIRFPFLRLIRRNRLNDKPVPNWQGVIRIAPGKRANHNKGRNTDEKQQAHI